MLQPELIPTSCAICGTRQNAVELYPANFDNAAFTSDIFSARRLPDLLHFRLVKCNSCGLVRSDPIVDTKIFETLYRQSYFRYEQDVVNLNRTYGGYLRKLEKYHPPKGRLLEIGCGNGFFLKEALSQGYEEVRGIEPSENAVQAAIPELRSFIACDVMRDGLFEPESFDVICMFQLFDHILEPGIFLRDIKKTLKQGGFVLALNHNVEAFSARLMGERSPIVDIEHTFLYSPKTMGRLFEKNGFRVLESGPAFNQINLHSLVRLIPFPSQMKQIILGIFTDNSVGSISLTLPLGNLYMIARKETQR